MHPASYGEPLPVNLTGSSLFQLCAAHPGDDGYWSEFIRRYAPLLARSVAVAWRRYGPTAWPMREEADDLLQDIYAAILKDDCRLLRQFRGASDAEAEAYLAHTAINLTISHLRAMSAKKRQAELLSLETLVAEQGGRQFVKATHPPLKLLTETELVEVLRHICTGSNSERDILIFLLHARDGWTAAEIARLKICTLKETSIANLLVQIKARVRKYYAAE